MDEFNDIYFFIIIVLGLFTVIEQIAVQRFNRFFFNSGIKVKNTIIHTTGWRIKIPSDTVIKLGEGKFSFTSDNRVYFLSQLFWFEMFRVNTPFPIRSVATIRYDNRIEVVSRIPLSATLFIVGFFFLYFSVAAAEIKEFIWVGAGIFLFLVALSYFIENRRLKIMIEELKSIITATD